MKLWAWLHLSGTGLLRCMNRSNRMRFTRTHTTLENSALDSADTCLARCSQLTTTYQLSHGRKVDDSQSGNTQINYVYYKQYNCCTWYPLEVGFHARPERTGKKNESRTNHNNIRDESFRPSHLNILCARLIVSTDNAGGILKYSMFVRTVLESMDLCMYRSLLGAR